MALRRRNRRVMLINLTTTEIHLINSLHIPRSFSNPVERDLLDEDVANENQRGNDTTIFHPSFEWEEVLDRIERTISSPHTIRSEGGLLIYERTFLSAIGQRVVWDRHGNLNRIRRRTLRVVARSSVRQSPRNPRRMQRCYEVITAYPI